jgi:biotin carboxylase
LVVKPIGGSASRGVAVVFSRAELQPYLAQSGYIAQEAAFPTSWTRKDRGIVSETVHRGGSLRQEDEISIQVVFDHVGEHLGTFTSVNRLQSGVPIFVDPQRVPRVEEVVERMAEALRDRGLIGPCNFQSRLTEQGPKVFEVNPRFTGITGVRAAMGFNEVEAVLRRALFEEPIEAVRASLVQPTDRLSVRYVDEMIVPRARLEEMGA